MILPENWQAATKEQGNETDRKIITKAIQI